MAMTITHLCDTHSTDRPVQISSASKYLSDLIQKSNKPKAPHPHFTSDFLWGFNLVLDIIVNPSLHFIMLTR